MLHKKTSFLLLALGFIVGAGTLVYAATDWQGTDSIKDGSIIQASTIKDNFDYLYERGWNFLHARGSASSTHITNSLPVAASAYCDENGENCIKTTDFNDDEANRDTVATRMKNLYGSDFPPKPEDVSGWPDYIICDATYAGFRGIVLPLLDFRAEGVLRYQHTDGPGFGFDPKTAGGVFFGGTAVNCGTDLPNSHLATICEDGRCGYYGGGSPVVASTEYSWDVGEWGSCTPVVDYNTCGRIGIRTRTASCVDSTGNTVNDSNCREGARSVEQEYCTTPVEPGCRGR